MYTVTEYIVENANPANYPVGTRLWVIYTPAGNLCGVKGNLTFAIIAAAVRQEILANRV